MWGRVTLEFPPPVNPYQLIQGSHRTCKMGPPGRKTMGSELARVREALDKRENPLSEEEMHFIQRCCQILKIDEIQNRVHCHNRHMGRRRKSYRNNKCHPYNVSYLGHWRVRRKHAEEIPQHSFKPHKIQAIWMHQPVVYSIWLTVPEDCQMQCRENLLWALR